MLSLVEQTVRSFVSSGEKATTDLVGFSRVRFKSKVSPDVATLRVRLRAVSAAARSFEFRVEADGVLACTGVCEV
jgi:hypothetical protein